MNRTLGESMRTMKVDLVLVNDYADGKRNGEKKTVECLLSNESNLKEIKEYIEEKYELNLEDMWKIEKVSYN